VNEEAPGPLGDVTPNKTEKKIDVSIVCLLSYRLDLLQRLLETEPEKLEAKCQWLQLNGVTVRLFPSNIINSPHNTHKQNISM
jgi:hypothetical protein